MNAANRVNRPISTSVPNTSSITPVIQYSVSGAWLDRPSRYGKPNSFVSAYCRITSAVMKRSTLSSRGAHAAQSSLTFCIFLRRELGLSLSHLNRSMREITPRLRTPRRQKRTRRAWGAPHNRNILRSEVLRGSAPLLPLDLGDLVGLGAARRHHLDRVALLLADQRTRQRRGDRDAALLRVGLGLADDLPHLLLLGIFVDQRNGRAELDGLAGQL